MPKDNFSTHQVMGTAHGFTAIFDNTSISSANNSFGAGHAIGYVLDPASGDPNVYVDLTLLNLSLNLNANTPMATPPVVALQQIGSGGGGGEGVPQIIYFEEKVGFLTDEDSKTYEEL